MTGWTKVRARRLAMTFSAVAVVLLTVTACASLGMGGPPDVAGEYDLRLSREGAEYRGMVSLVGAEGGTLTVTEPITVEETELTLERMDSVYRFTAPYRVVQNGCSGTLRMEGTRGPSGGFSGDAVLMDECVGDVPMEFTMTAR